MHLTKSQLESLAQDLAERAVERFEDTEGRYTEDQWDDILCALVPDFENALDSTWPDHIPPLEER